MTANDKIALWAVIGSAAAGVLGVVAAIVVPIVSEKMRRNGARDELLMTHKLVLYADLLKVARRALNDADHIRQVLRSNDPDGISENPFTLTDADLEDVLSRAHILTSEPVLAELKTFGKQWDDFTTIVTLNAALLARRGGVPYSKTGSGLGPMAARKIKALKESFTRMSDLIRAEMGETPAPRQRLPWSNRRPPAQRVIEASAEPATDAANSDDPDPTLVVS
jgi:hypothetical protein